jgi:hypothetical protein
MLIPRDALALLENRSEKRVGLDTTLLKGNRLDAGTSAKPAECSSQRPWPDKITPISNWKLELMTVILDRANTADYGSEGKRE